MIYTNNYMEYEVSNDSYDNSIEFIRFIKAEGLSGEEVLNLLLDWHGTALTSKAMMENLFTCEYSFDVKEDEL